MSTVLGFGKISCDSACWWNLIFPSPKKKLKAASSGLLLRSLACVLRVSLCVHLGLWWLQLTAGSYQQWLVFIPGFIFSNETSEPVVIFICHLVSWRTLRAMFFYPACPSAQGWHTPCPEKCNRVTLAVTQNILFVWLFLTSSKRLQREGGWVPLLLVVSFSFEPPTHPTCPYGECTLIRFSEYAWNATYL